MNLANFKKSRLFRLCRCNPLPTKVAKRKANRRFRRTSKSMVTNVICAKIFVCRVIFSKSGFFVLS